ncbi:MAG: globin [Proteobacteria bacterium]|nr:globin [Pseudomonadota bacterium]
MKFDELLMDTFNESLERCQTDPHFLTLFYRKFVISNPEVQEKFSNTDMEYQKMMLHASLYMIMLATRNNDAAEAYLDRVAKRHSKSALDIRPELYDLWLETLIETVKEIDSIFNDDVENAWRTVMTFGIDYMKSKYDD